MFCWCRSRSGTRRSGNCAIVLALRDLERGLLDRLRDRRSAAAPSSVLARAAAGLISPSARMNPRGIVQAADREVLDRALGLRAPQRVGRDLAARPCCRARCGNRSSCQPLERRIGTSAITDEACMMRTPKSACIGRTGNVDSATLTALSPLDGRYAAQSGTAAPMPLRIRADPLSHADRGALAAASRRRAERRGPRRRSTCRSSDVLNEIVDEFSLDDAQQQ